MNPRSMLALLGSAFIATGTMASTTGQLPAWVCAHPDAIHVHGFEAQAARYVEASNGSGGLSGSRDRLAAIPGGSTKPYYLYAPPISSPSRPMPLILLLHGAGGPNTAVDAAKTLRNLWSVVSERDRVIVVSMAGSDTANGSWLVPYDYFLLRNVLADVRSSYNIDLSRTYSWGFSAGGHVIHDLVFGPDSAGINIQTFAAYSVWAGGLEGLACSTPDCPALLNAAERKIPVDLRVGNADFASQPHVLGDFNRFQAAGWVAGSTVWYNEFPGGHEFEPAYFGEIWDHLCPFQRLP